MWSVQRLLCVSRLHSDRIVKFYKLKVVERGNSMPNVTLLIPIADVLGITVTELLQGEKLKENKTLNSLSLIHI